MFGQLLTEKKMVNEREIEKALEIQKTNNLFKRDRKEDANGIEDHFRTEQLCLV